DPLRAREGGDPRRAADGNAGVVPAGNPHLSPRGRDGFDREASRPLPLGSGRREAAGEGEASEIVATVSPSLAPPARSLPKGERRIRRGGVPTDALRLDEQLALAGALAVAEHLGAVL